MRSSWARAVAGPNVAPSPTRPPIAVPVAALVEARRKSRRERSMAPSPCQQDCSAPWLELIRAFLHGVQIPPWPHSPTVVVGYTSGEDRDGTDIWHLEREGLRCA